jgi:hypothetical protein
MKCNHRWMIILCCVFTISGCNQKPKLTSDKIILASFQSNRSKLTSLVTPCFSSSIVKKPTAKVCSDESTLAELKVKEINIRHPGELLFVVDRYVDKSLTHTLVYEKGYAYTNKRTVGNLIKAPTLDDFPSAKIIEKSDPETWLYREIEPNWYVYYRCFYRYTDNISTEYEGE